MVNTPIGLAQFCDVPPAGPVQHGNAPLPAQTPCSWWYTVRGRCRQEALGRCDRQRSGVIGGDYAVVCTVPDRLDM